MPLSHPLGDIVGGVLSFVPSCLFFLPRMSLSPLAIGLIAGLGGASLLGLGAYHAIPRLQSHSLTALAVVLLLVLHQRKSSHGARALSSFEQGASVTNTTPVIISAAQLGSNLNSAYVTSKAQ